MKLFIAQLTHLLETIKGHVTAVSFADVTKGGVEWLAEQASGIPQIVRLFAAAIAPLVVMRFLTTFSTARGASPAAKVGGPATSAPAEALDVFFPTGIRTVPLNGCSQIAVRGFELRIKGNGYSFRTEEPLCVQYNGEIGFALLRRAGAAFPISNIKKAFGPLDALPHGDYSVTLKAQPDFMCRVPPRSWRLQISDGHPPSWSEGPHVELQSSSGN